MGLLAPLYALAALAIVGPIIFHLIKRQPTGQIPFSSLMFLSPSPPTLTRRSRVDNWLLLLLRSLAILLLAIAFTRPYFRQQSTQVSALSGRTVVLVVDTSASMQRSDVWAETLNKADALLDSLSPEDRAALYTVDDGAHAILPVASLAGLDAQDSRTAVRSELRQLEPTWQATQLAKGLKSIVDEMIATTITGDAADSVEQSIVLLSDLHEDCGLDALQGYEWPEGVTLDVRQVLPDQLGNARLNLVPPSPDEDSDDVKVRVENASDAIETVYGLSWVTAADDVISQTNVQVPPGQSRVVSMGQPPPGGTKVLLTGDVWDADNTTFNVRRQEVLETIVFSGDTALPDVQRLDYFLEKVPLDVGPLKRQLLLAGESEALRIALQNPQTAAVFVEPSQAALEQVDGLLEFAQSGGVVVVCLAREMDGSNEASVVAEPLLKPLLGVASLTVSEAAKRDFSLLSNVDYKHPVFAAFADPRFNDFSKLRFWSHRRIEFPGVLDGQTDESAIGPRVVARLDDGAPLMLERAVGQGQVWVIAAGWQPEASGLALSSKFVPILRGVLDRQDPLAQWTDAYEVGDLVPVPTDGECDVVDANENDLPESVFSQAAGGVRFHVPGLYKIVSGDAERQVMVSVPVSESRLVPMDRDVVEQFGAKTASLESDSLRRELDSQLKVEQLESQQRLWQWLIAIGLGVLAVESLVAAIKTRPGGSSVPVGS